MPQNWCFWAVVLEKTLESPSDYKEIQPVHPKGNHSWIFLGRTDAEAKTPVLWPPDVKNWLIVKDPSAGEDGRREEKEIRGWDGWMASRLDGHDFEQASGVGDGLGRLVCCSPWGHKESDKTEWLNWTELYCPWNSPGQNTGVGNHSLFQGIFPTQGSNSGLPHCTRILYQLSQRGSPRILEWVAYPFSRGFSQPRSGTGVSCIAGGFFTNWAMREAWVSLL